MERHVVSVNEFLATCNWQVVGVQVEQNRHRTEPLGRPLRWGLQELVSLPMCTLKHWSRSSRLTSWVNQYGMLLLSLQRRPVCQTVSYAAVKSRKTAPVFRFCWNLFSIKVVRAATWWQVLRPFGKPAWSGLSKPLTVGEMRWSARHSRSL